MARYFFLVFLCWRRPLFQSLLHPGGQCPVVLIERFSGDSLLGEYSKMRVALCCVDWGPVDTRDENSALRSVFLYHVWCDQ